MDYELLKPWIVLGGYVVAFGLLWLGQRARDRALLVTEMPTPQLVKGLDRAAGLVATATTLYWLTLGTFSGPFMVVWAVFPVAAAVWLWTRKHRQADWMDRVAGRSGTVFGEQNRGRPSFGVLPGGGLAVDNEDPRGDYDTAVEADLRGHRVLGIQYTLGQGGQRHRPELWSGQPEHRPGQLEQTVNAVGNTFNMVQLRTPHVPSLRIEPRSGDERLRAYGALEAGKIRPFEEARFTRNVFGGLTPEGDQQPFDADDDSFFKYFSVRTSDADFARSVLTAEVRDMVANEPWFRVREVVFHNGALWTNEFGELTEHGLLANARQLARLSAVVPAAAWSHRAAGGVGDRGEVQRFLAAAGSLEATEKAWSGIGGMTDSVNERRTAADRQPLSMRSILVRVVLVLAFSLAGVSVAGNGLLSLLGLAPEVSLTVTSAYSRSCTGGDSNCSSGDWVSGTYRADGETRSITQSRWMSFTEPPDKHDVIDVSIGPFWWHPMIERADAAIFLVLYGCLPLLAAAALFTITFFPPRRRRQAVGSGRDRRTTAKGEPA